MAKRTRKQVRLSVIRRALKEAGVVNGHNLTMSNGLKALAKVAKIDLTGLSQIPAALRVAEHFGWASEVAVLATHIVPVRPQTPKAPKQPSTARGPSEAKMKAFYQSWEWKRLSYQTKIDRGRRCECCGATPDSGARIVTDHIKPIRHHWALRLDPTNCQVLCNDCNMGKGSRDQTDWRADAPEDEPAEMSFERWHGLV